MKRAILLLTLIAIYSCVKVQKERKVSRYKKLFEIKKLNKRQFKKWQKNLLNQVVGKEEIENSYEEIAKKVNKLNSTWKATIYKKNYKPLLGSILDGLENLPEKKFKNKNFQLPDEYDPRIIYPKCESLKEVRDQANCGADWAFGAVEAMSDRVCIASGQTDQRRVSAQNLLTCCSTCGFGCDGGYGANAWKYWKDIGITTGGLYGEKNTCQPYFLPPCDHNIKGSYGECPETVETPTCITNCNDGNGADYASNLIKGSSAYSVSGEANIMQEIYENGPVEATFTVYEDFVTYSSGIYQHVTGSTIGGHSIKILGWGVEDGVKYWICANSWNSEWGDGGFFKIKKGSNECGIESNANAGEYIPEDLTDIFESGPYQVKTTDVASGDSSAPRQFRIYEPTGISGKVPVIHFLHGFQLKFSYYDDLLTQLSSHGFLVISGQSEHKLIGGDTTYKEAEKVLTFINWLKENLASKVSVVPDFDNLGVSGHSRGGKVTNRILNSYPNIAKSFFGVDPVDSAPPMSGSTDPPSLNDPVQFKGESMFVGTEKGPSGISACAPSGDNSNHFYSSFPSISHHIIGAGVGHMDMIDSADLSACGLVCSVCAGTSDSKVKTNFISYTSGLMAAFFSSTLKGMSQYEALLNDASKHPFSTTVVEFK
jgi:cathepsin B